MLWWSFWFGSGSCGDFHGGSAANWKLNTSDELAGDAIRSVAQAWVWWPITAQWAYWEGGLKETRANTECFRLSEHCAASLDCMRNQRVFLKTRACKPVLEEPKKKADEISHSDFGLLQKINCVELKIQVGQWCYGCQFLNLRIWCFSWSYSIADWIIWDVWVI